MAGFADWRARPHRVLYWSAVLLALAVLVGGTAVAYASYQETAGPAGAVKGYFAALERGDAPAALGFGELPSGPDTLLTSAVLREQQRLAPIRDLKVVSTSTAGSTATVKVRYRLAFADGAQLVSDVATVNHIGGSWRLAATAASTQLVLLQAVDRATILGAAVPDGPILLFPGAVPIRFDTPYLRLTQATSVVQLAAVAPAELAVEVTEQGRSVLDAALAKALAPCLAGPPSADPTCPMPAARSVPGSLHGTLIGQLAASTTISVEPVAAGVIDLNARVKVSGSYQTLDFDNIAVTKRGTATLPVRATAFATSPTVLTWQDDQS